MRRLSCGSVGAMKDNGFNLAVKSSWVRYQITQVLCPHLVHQQHLLRRLQCMGTGADVDIPLHFQSRWRIACAMFDCPRMSKAVQAIVQVPCGDSSGSMRQTVAPKFVAQGRFLANSLLDRKR